MPTETTPLKKSSLQPPTFLDSIQQWPWVEIFFLFYMGICGAVSMTVSYSITDLASHCGETATGLGIVFLWEAIGGIVGAISSVYLYHYFPGNWILIIVGWLLGGTLISMPFITDSVILEVAYFLVGIFAVIIHIGCLYLVRQIQKDSAGHWLALTQAAVSIGSTLLYILDWKFDMSSQAQYILLTSIVCIVSTVFVIVLFKN